MSKYLSISKIKKKTLSGGESSKFSIYIRPKDLKNASGQIRALAIISKQGGGATLSFADFFRKKPTSKFVIYFKVSTLSKVEGSVNTNEVKSKLIKIQEKIQLAENLIMGDLYNTVNDIKNEVNNINIKRIKKSTVNAQLVKAEEAIPIEQSISLDASARLSNVEDKIIPITSKIRDAAFKLNEIKGELFDQNKKDWLKNFTNDLITKIQVLGLELHNLDINISEVLKQL